MKDNIDLKLKGEDVPEYLRDFLNKYTLDLQKLTVESVELWAEDVPQSFKSFLARVGAPDFIARGVIAASTINPLMDHAVSMVLFASGGDLVKARSLIDQMTEQSLTKGKGMSDLFQGGVHVPTKH